MTSISGEAIGGLHKADHTTQLGSGVSVVPRKMMSTEFITEITADVLESNIRKRIKGCTHRCLRDEKLTDELVWLVNHNNRNAYHYEFTFFDTAAPDKPNPFLLVYTLAKKVDPNNIAITVMSMISDNSILAFCGQDGIPIRSTYGVTEVVPPASGLLPKYFPTVINSTNGPICGTCRRGVCKCGDAPGMPSHLGGGVIGYAGTSVIPVESKSVPKVYYSTYVGTSDNEVIGLRDICLTLVKLGIIKS